MGTHFSQNNYVGSNVWLRFINILCLCMHINWEFIEGPELNASWSDLIVTFFQNCENCTMNVQNYTLPVYVTKHEINLLLHPFGDIRIISTPYPWAYDSQAQFCYIGYLSKGCNSLYIIIIHIILQASNSIWWTSGMTFSNLKII